MRLRCVGILLLLLCFVQPTFAQQLEMSERKELPLLVLSKFWGAARSPDGEKLFPADERERTTLPISEKIAQQVIDVGQISGAAERCGLDWHENYLTLRQTARSARYSVKQVAFIGVLHGATQQTLINKLKNSTCSDGERQQAREMLKVSPNKLVADGTTK